MALSKHIHLFEILLLLEYERKTSAELLYGSLTFLNILPSPTLIASLLCGALHKYNWTTTFHAALLRASLTSQHETSAKPTTHGQSQIIVSMVPPLATAYQEL